MSVQPLQTARMSAPLETALTQAKRLPLGPPVFRANQYVVPTAATRPTPVRPGRERASRDERSLGAALRRMVRPAFDRSPEELIDYMVEKLPEFIEVMNAIQTVAKVRSKKTDQVSRGTELLEAVASELRGQVGMQVVARAMDGMERAFANAGWLSKHEPPKEHHARDAELAGDFHFYVAVHQFAVCATFMAPKLANDADTIDLVIQLVDYGAEEAYIATRLAMDLRDEDLYNDDDPMFADLQVSAV